MIDKNPEVLKSRFEAAKSDWTMYRSRMEEAYEFTQPYRNKFEEITPGQRRGMNVFDTTAVNATTAFVSKMQKLLTPPNHRFMVLKPGADVPDFIRKDVDDMLQTINDTVWKYINQSNGILAMGESYFDIVCGTGALTIQKGTIDNPLIFASHPLSKVYLERSTVNTIQNVWREFNIPVEDVFIMWPKATMPQELLDKNKTTQGNGLVDIAEGTLLDYDRKTNTAKYYYTVLYQGQEIFSQELKSSPWIIYRWLVPPNETYGIGVANIAMPTIKSLNQMYGFMLTQGAFAINPPILYRSDMGWNNQNTRLQPGSSIPVTGIGMDQMPIRPLEFGANFSVSVDMVQDLRNQINKIFYNDPLGSTEESVRTATEMTMRNQANAEQMSGAFGRIAIEYLTAMMDRILSILSDFGLIPEIQIDGSEIDLEFQIPLMQAQGLDSLSKLIQTKEAIAALAGERVAAMSMNNLEIPLWTAENIGADTRLVKSPQMLEQEISSLVKNLRNAS